MMSAESDMRDHTYELRLLREIWPEAQRLLQIAHENVSFTQCQLDSLTAIQSAIHTALVHCNPYLMTGCECDAAKRGETSDEE